VLAVAADSGAVLLVEAIPFRLAALGGVMVQRPPQHPRTEVVPVGVAAQQMQMPHLIHLVGRRDRMVCHQGQEHKLAVLLDGAQGKGPAPAVGAHQMGEKAELMALII
jgi:hypothetical protein